MARTVPGALGRVPLHDAPEVRADGGKLAHSAARVAVYGDLLESIPHHGARPGGNLVGLDVLAGGNPVEVLPRDVRVFLNELSCRAHRLAGGIVDLFPGIRLPADQV